MRISDCTLRDTRHSPGIFISIKEAVEIAYALDRLGVDEIEAGILNGSKTESDYISTLLDLGLNAKISGLSFCTSMNSAKLSIEQAVELGLDTICISIPTSPQFIEVKLNRSFRATIVLMTKAVKLAIESGLNVTFTGEDAARANIDDLIKYVLAGQEAGASRFRFAESVSCISPSEMGERIAQLSRAVDIPIEVHCHSAYGLACANTVAAIDAGANWASVTIDGLGERGGNTALAPIILYLIKHKKSKRFNTTELTQLSKLLRLSVPNGVERYSAITGSECFNYEIGKQFANKHVYEDYSPESVGNFRSLVFGLKADAKAAEISFNMKALPNEVIDEVKQYVKNNRRALSASEVEQLIVEVRPQNEN